MIYKYRPINPDTLKTLLNNNLYCSNPLHFNDPFDANATVDFSGEFLNDPLEYFNKLFLNQYELIDQNAANEARNETKKLIEKGEIDSIKNFILDLFQFQFTKEGKYDPGVLCLSYSKENILMWAHYAEEHRGIVLGFDDNYLPFKAAKKVYYPKTNELYKLTPEKQDNAILEPLFIKSPLWEYEQEVRFINPDGPGLISFPSESLKEIYFGCRTKKDDMLTVIRTLSQKQHIITFFKGFKSRNYYSLDFEKITI